MMEAARPGREPRGIAAGPHYVLTPRSNPDLLTCVIPIHNEQEVLRLLLPRLMQLLNDLPCPAEVILVNDGSCDRSMEILLEAVQTDLRFGVLCLARNFGHQIAATAGLDAARGDAVVLMDADLQDPPELVHQMLGEYRKGYDIVYAQRVSREGESVFKRLSAWAFYRLMRCLVHRDLPADAGDFRLMSRPALDALRSMRELHRFLRGMVAWIGFPQIAVPLVRPKRAAGRTKYPLRKMLSLAWNAATSFSPMPLRLILLMGLVSSLMSLGYGLFAVFAVISGRDVVRGWASAMAFTGFIGGVLMISLGILGEYVGKIFEEVKGRPLYVVSQAVNIGVPVRGCCPEPQTGGEPGLPR